MTTEQQPLNPMQLTIDACEAVKKLRPHIVFDRDIDVCRLALNMIGEDMEVKARLRQKRDNNADKAIHDPPPAVVNVTADRADELYAEHKARYNLFQPTNWIEPFIDLRPFPIRTPNELILLLNDIGGIPIDVIGRVCVHIAKERKKNNLSDKTFV